MAFLRKACRKIKDSRRGETLVEVLCASVVGTLAVAALFTCIAAASDSSYDASVLDAAYYVNVSKAESKDSAALDAEANVTGPYGELCTTKVKLYGGGGVYSYAE